MASKRMSDRDLVKKTAIGKAAARVFHATSYAETSLDDIAAEARVSKGSIYYYFASKHEILFFILDAYVDKLRRGLEDELRRVPPGLERIKLVARRHMSLYNGSVPEATVLFRDAHSLKAKEYRLLASKQKEYARLLAEALSDYFDGALPAPETQAMAYVLFGMCNSIMAWHNPGGALGVGEVTEMCLNIFLKGTAHYVGARSVREVRSA